MRFTVQRYEAVPVKSSEPSSLDTVDSSPSNSASICAERRPVVRFHNADDNKVIQDDGGKQEERATLLNNDDHQDSRVALQIDCDSTATVRPTSNRKISVAVDHVAQRGRWLYAQRNQCRLVYKDGTCNVITRNIVQRKRRYLVDIFTTFVDMKWRYNLLLFGLAFVGSWFAFALIWWIQAVVHEDYRSLNETDWPSCVANVYDFPTALLFSVETQHTIGYGTRAIETNCVFGAIILMLQSCYGVFVQSMMTGLIFAKLSRPKRRAQTMMFSKLAVICQRDHEYCLLFRLGDMRRSHIIATSIRALMVKNRETREGESIPLCQYSLAVETETNFGDNFVFLVWPVTVVHRIVQGSPLWNMSAASLLQERFEIIVIFEGIVENTGMTTQFRTSYMPSEIQWGYRLEPLVTYCKTNGQYDIDFTQFHITRPVDHMPECSAKEFLESVNRNSFQPSHCNEWPEAESDFQANFTTIALPKTRKHQKASNSTSSLRKLVFRKKMAKKNGIFVGEVPTIGSSCLNQDSSSDSVKMHTERRSDVADCSSRLDTVNNNENTAVLELK